MQISLIDSQITLQIKNGLLAIFVTCVVHFKKQGPQLHFLARMRFIVINIKSKYVLISSMQVKNVN